MYAMVVSLAAAAVCVTVKIASTGPASSPFPVAAMPTVAVSFSTMVIVALSAAPSIVTPGSPAAMVASVTITESFAASKSLSSMTGTMIVAVDAPPGIVTVPLSAV